MQADMLAAPLAVDHRSPLDLALSCRFPQYHAQVHVYAATWLT